jgi:hypothetical protein
MNKIRYRICKMVESYKTKPVFENDVNPHPAVCLEAVLEVDASEDNVRVIASKHYPDQSVAQ